MSPEPPCPPRRKDPSDWRHYELWKRVRQALRAVPDRFSSPTRIAGLLVQDLFTLNAPLAATIEEQFVRTLNGLRPVWDPDGAYGAYAFERQSQTFPDVVLRRSDDGREILLGIELKGWYLLAREGVPTYRFTATAAACNAWDLLVVVPWVLEDILSGAPILYAPFVESARYCAETRNHYWMYQRSARSGHFGPGSGRHLSVSCEERSHFRQAGEGRRRQLRTAGPLRDHGRIHRANDEDADPGHPRRRLAGVLQTADRAVVGESQAT